MTLRRRILNWIASTVAIFVILLAILLGLFRLAAAQLPAYRADLEEKASIAVGLPVRFGAVDARLGLSGPELIFHDARVLDPDSGAVLVRARRGGVTLDLLAMIRDGKISATRVFLDGATLKLERTRDGLVRIPGLETTGAGSGDGLSASELPLGIFELTHTNLVVEDLGNELGPWSFRDVELQVQNNGRNIIINGRVELPDDLGESLTVRAELNDIAGGEDIERWQAHVQAVQLNFSNLSGLTPERFRVIEEGSGDLGLHVFVEGGQLDHASVRMDLDDVRIFLSPGSAASIGYQSIEGRLELDRVSNGWSVVGKGIQIEQTGRTWERCDIQFDYFDLPAGESVGWPANVGYEINVSASFVGIEELAVLAGWLPGKEIRDRILEVRPAGRLRNLSVNYKDRGQEKGEYQVSTEFEDLALPSREGVPGLRGVSGQLSATNDGGEISLHSKALELDAAGMFRAPLLFDAVSGELKWRQSVDGLQVSARNLTIRRQAMQVVTTATVDWPDNGEPQIQLNTQVSDLQVADISALLPVGVMRENLIYWLDNALLAGSIPEAKLVIDGPLKKIP
ncbi:MAG: hypothetical protein O6931_01450, partial [Gammaproteobacteria bacterium]|nr:hypothetical protein [Gammaproteobacteria bacterium]